MKISALAILITVLLGPVGIGNCIQDRLLGVEAINYFSSDYGEARRKFLEASRAAGAHIESFENHFTGPEGESLFTDVALIGPNNASTILVLGSGTHGVEGFTGSAIQTGLLSEGFNSVQKPGLGILFIHAINPYGFAHLRRFNEVNVDVNRNFVDHSKPHPVNPGYEELTEAISPNSISFWANVKSIFKLFRYRLINGKEDLRKAISGGQYTDPQGIFYGGQNETWSNKTIRAISSRYLSNAERVVFIDFHTGLGPYGNAEVILNEKEHSPAYKRAVEWWGDIAQTTASGKSISVHLQTTLKHAIPKMLPHTEVTAVSLEFGTFSALKVFGALREESWLHHYGAKEYPDRSKIKTELLRMFYPDDDAWKLKVWEQGQKIVGQTLAHL
jgi:hypothetical protein